VASKTTKHVSDTLCTGMSLPAIKCQTPSKTQTNRQTNGQTPGIEFAAL